MEYGKIKLYQIDAIKNNFANIYIDGEDYNSFDTILGYEICEKDPHGLIEHIQLCVSLSTLFTKSRYDAKKQAILYADVICKEIMNINPLQEYRFRNKDFDIENFYYKRELNKFNIEIALTYLRKLIIDLSLLDHDALNIQIIDKEFIEVEEINEMGDWTLNINLFRLTNKNRNPRTKNEIQKLHYFIHFIHQSDLMKLPFSKGSVLRQRLHTKYGKTYFNTQTTKSIITNKKGLKGANKVQKDFMDTFKARLNEEGFINPKSQTNYQSNNAISKTLFHIIKEFIASNFIELPEIESFFRIDETIDFALERKCVSELINDITII